MLDIMYKRRSIRQFLNTPVEKEKIDQLVKASLLAPSSRGTCSQRFIIVDDKDVLEKLSRAKEHGSSFVKNAPLAFVIAADTDASDVWIEDAAIAAAYIQLQAQSLGLGSCWSQIRKREHETGIDSSQYIKELLNLPQEYNVLCIIAIGYPGERKPEHTDRDLNRNRALYNNFKNKYQL